MHGIIEMKWNGWFGRGDAKTHKDSHMFLKVDIPSTKSHERISIIKFILRNAYTLHPMLNVIQ